MNGSGNALTGITNSSSTEHRAANANPDCSAVNAILSNLDSNEDQKISTLEMESGKHSSNCEDGYGDQGLRGNAEKWKPV
ncbi:hypothetical protein Acr_29g0003510 [Actinidia rufa]|uniref:Uncharacterized protein n=1 Tax=Actinidia rufa TaxID=165716 RepID=A0A7J0HDN8_9ERIC|nr:hypothetical protein Acr_29g0003510 [Actinidia rufa]